MPSHLIGAAIFCGCALSVWVLRGGDSEATASSGTTAESSSRKTSKTARGSAGKGGVPAEVAGQLAAVRAGQTVEDRLRATIQLAESIPVGDIEEWFTKDWFDGKEDMQSYLFYRIARARWLKADPEGLMNYCLREKSDRTSEVAALWADQDPVAALNFAVGLTDKAQRSNIFSQIGGKVAKAEPQLALDSLAKLAAALDPNQVQGGLSEVVRELAESSPALLKAKFNELPDSLRPAARSYLTRIALKQDFHGTVAELSGAADGKQMFSSAMQNNPELMKEITKHLDALPQGWFAEAASKGGYNLVRDDPKKWLDTDLSAMDFSPEQAERLRSYALSSLGSKNPEQVIALLAGQTLSEDERSTAIYSVVGTMASDKEKVEAWIATLTDEKDIQLAKSALKSRSGTEKEKAELTPTSLLSSLAEGTSLNWSQTRIAGKWGSEERAVLAKEFAALPPEQKGKVANKFLESDHNNFPTSIKADALRYLLENPGAVAKPEGSGQRDDRKVFVRTAAQIGSSWAEENPGEASRWIDTLPAGNERIWAAKNLAARWSEYEPAEMRQWLGSLPAEERAEVQKYLDSGEAYR